MREQGRAGILRRAIGAMEGTSEPALLIRGPIGSGRSHLLRELARVAPIRSVLVVARRTEEAWPLSGLGTLCTAIAREPCEHAPRGDLDAVEVHALAMDVIERMRREAIEPTVALVDDVDRFDPLSRAVLGYLSGRLNGSGLHIIGSVGDLRPDDPLTGFPVCDLPPLEIGEAIEVARLADAPADAATAAILAWQAAGNPGVLTAALESLTADERAGRAGIPLPLPPMGPAPEIVRAETAGLDVPAQEMLAQIAAAPVTPRVVLGHSSSEQDALSDLLERRLVEEVQSYVRVRSSLVRSVVYWALPGRERRELHSALRLRLDEVDEALSVWHASWAEPHGGWAPGLLSAATRLMRADLPGAGMELAERGMASHGNGSVSVRALEFAGALLDTGRLVQAGRYVGRIDRESLPPSEQLTFALVRLVSDVARDGRISLAELEAAAAVHAEADPDGAASLLAIGALLAALQDDLHMARAALDASSAHLDGAGPLARSLHLGVDELIAAAVGGRGGPADPGVLRELPRHSTEELIARGRAWSLSGDTLSAARVFSLVADLPGPIEPVWRGLATLLAADNALRGGDLRAASAAVRQLREGQPFELLQPLWELVELRVDLVVEDVPGTVERLRAWVAGVRGTPGTRAAARALLAEHALFLGDPQEAVRELQRADGLAAHLANPAMLRHQPAFIEALMAVDDVAGAREVLEALERAARSMPHPWTHRATLVGRALATRGEESRRLLDALAHAAGPEPDYEDAMLLVRRARRLRLLGAADAEIATLQARTSLERLGAHGWARLLDGPSPEPHVIMPTAALDVLTQDEQTVVELVRQGLQNKEIAARLYISLRTVELRLTHIYRKTGARSRSHLVALLV